MTRRRAACLLVNNVRAAAQRSRGVHNSAHLTASLIDKPDRGVVGAMTAVETSFKPSQLKVPLARYGGRQMVTVIPGDGIGPEMMRHVQNIFEVAQVPIDFEQRALSGQVADAESDDRELSHALMSIERNGVALMGNIETRQDAPGVVSRNVRLRSQLDLYAHMVHAKSIPDIQTRHKDIDVIVIRENVEGEYSGLEHETVPGVVESLKIVTRKNIERIARFAFNYASTHDRKKVTAVHKANIMKIADGYFLKVCSDVAADYPAIEFENMIVDNASMQMVSHPQQFDVMVMPNLYGNIISNIAVGLCGGPGVFAGRNLGERYAATRGTGTELAGKNVANPMGFIRAGIALLRYLGKGERPGDCAFVANRIGESADMIEKSLWRVVLEKQIRTVDLNGTHGTQEVVDAIIAEIENEMQLKKISSA